jgi:DNA polymerase-3 subunit alpha
VFQFESGGMQDLLMKMQPDRIEDLIAANALYRPGPMELIPLYCNRKHGREKVPEVHPIMDAILSETYGIMVYQEQVMQIFNQLGGIELSAAYKLIKAISKKTTDVIAKFQPDFIKGTMSKGVSKEKAEEIFDLILKFGGYGFNKSHSTRYAIVAFQTAYMKVYHPVEYMSALLTFEMGSTDKVVEYIEECRRLTMPDGRKGVRVLPPDINFSDKDFTPVYEKPAEPTGKGKRRMQLPPEGVIRFGLLAVRGAGEKAVEAVIEERNKKGAYTSLYDFCERVDLRTATSSMIESLIKCGAFSSLNAKRAQLLHVLDRAFEMGQQSQNDKRSGQMSIFGGGESKSASPVAAPALPDVDELPNAELLKYEKEFLGFYITSHPLTEHQATIDRYTTHTTRDAMGCGEGAEVTIGGMISRVKKTVTKNGRSAGMQMAMITLEDLDGQIDGVLFAETFADVNQKYPDAVAAESIVFIKGKVDKRRETPSIVVNEVLPVGESIPRMTTSIVLKFDDTRHNADVIGELRERLRKHAGRTPVFAQVATRPGQSVILKLPSDVGIKPSKELVSDLEQVLTSGFVQLVGAGTKRVKRAAQQALFKAESAAEEADGAGAVDEPAAAVDTEAEAAADAVGE